MNLAVLLKLLRALLVSGSPRKTIDQLAIDAGADLAAIWVLAHCVSGPFTGKCSTPDDARRLADAVDHTPGKKDMTPEFAAVELIWAACKARSGAGVGGESRIAKRPHTELDRRCSDAFFAETLHRARHRARFVTDAETKAPADGSREDVAAAITICIAVMVNIPTKVSCAELADALTAAIADQTITRFDAEVAVLSVVSYYYWTVPFFDGFTDEIVADLQAAIDGTIRKLVLPPIVV